MSGEMITTTLTNSFQNEQGFNLAAGGAMKFPVSNSIIKATKNWVSSINNVIVSDCSNNTALALLVLAITAETQLENNLEIMTRSKVINHMGIHCVLYAEYDPVLHGLDLQTYCENLNVKENSAYVNYWNKINYLYSPLLDIFLELQKEEHQDLVTRIDSKRTTMPDLDITTTLIKNNSIQSELEVIVGVIKDKQKADAKLKTKTKHDLAKKKKQEKQNDISILLSPFVSTEVVLNYTNISYNYIMHADNNFNQNIDAVTNNIVITTSCVLIVPAGYLILPSTPQLSVNSPGNDEDTSVKHNLCNQFLNNMKSTKIGTHSHILVSTNDNVTILRPNPKTSASHYGHIISYLCLPEIECDINSTNTKPTTVSRVNLRSQSWIVSVNLKAGAPTSKAPAPTSTNGYSRKKRKTPNSTAKNNPCKRNKRDNNETDVGDDDFDAGDDDDKNDVENDDDNDQQLRLKSLGKIFSKLRTIFTSTSL